MAPLDIMASKLVDLNQNSLWSMRILTYFPRYLSTWVPITYEGEPIHEHIY